MDIGEWKIGSGHSVSTNKKSNNLVYRLLMGVGGGKHFCKAESAAAAVGSISEKLRVLRLQWEAFLQS